MSRTHSTHDGRDDQLTCPACEGVSRFQERPPRPPAYGTSKAGLILLCKNAALEYGPFKIRCNALCPGMTRTELLDDGITGMAERLGTPVEGATACFASHLPLRRAAEPSEIAGVCAFLASDDSSFVTGAVIAADGGSLIVDVSGASL